MAKKTQAKDSTPQLDGVYIINDFGKSTLNRRKVRYRLFRIREGNDAYADGLKKLIQDQFRQGMTWETFTFSWDVGVNDPLKVIIKDEWEASGGGYNLATGGLHPAAFTNQRR